MSGQRKPPKIPSIYKLAERLHDDFQIGKEEKNFILLFAYNGTGKTRLSMEFKDRYRRKKMAKNTLYFNAYTEDLFYWDNDLQGDTHRVLKINADSQFFNGFKELALEEKIFTYLERYADFNFHIDYENWVVSFSRDVKVKKRQEEVTETVHNIKVSRGEENIFIWCVFLAICELVIDGAQAYNWVKYLYIDDPISSLDDNNAIAVACDLSKLLRRSKGSLKTIISSHHSLFFNVMCNELKKESHKRYFLHRCRNSNAYTLRATDDTPFLHHVAMLSELQNAITSGQLYTHHFNAMRSILEKTATFFGFDDFSHCLHKEDVSHDDVLYERALNLLSHGKYSTYEPKEMSEDNKQLFKNIFDAFTARYHFNLPAMLNNDTK